MVAPVMAVQAPKILSDVVKWEEELGYSREVATLASGVVALGTPLAKDAEGGIVPLPADGSLGCIGVAVNGRDASTAPAGGLVYIARAAILADFGIVWPAGVSAANIAKAVAEMRALPGPIKVELSA